jgi:AbrB family looped-hinge helix DNA binding protein
MRRRPTSEIRETAEPYGAGSTVSTKGQITIPKAVRERYGLAPGTEVQFEMREEGALLRRRRPERHPAWEKIGSLKGLWRWPKGIRSVDAYIDYVRGGSYEELTGRKSVRSRHK